MIINSISGERAPRRPDCFATLALTAAGYSVQRRTPASGRFL